MSDRHATLRILDANCNRAVEGLRAMEEYLRFVLSDRHLTERCKQLRHELVHSLAVIPLHELLAARDTPGDVGTQVGVPDEYQRASARQVWEANQKRVEQSLRCLEEYSKIQYPSVAQDVEQLRYRMYSLAKAIDTTERSGVRLRESLLYVLIDGGSSPEDFARRVTQLIEAGVHLLQLRDKRLADRLLIQRARQLRELTRGTRTQFIMNDRPDLAILAQADGVHLGQEEMSVADARALLGPDRLIGISTHSLAQARQAVWEGADYLGCGPTFASSTKSFSEFPGLDFLRHVAGELTIPAFAIGGINAENLPRVLETGIRRVAVSGAIAQSPDPASEVRRLLDLLA